ncbi:LysR family transcriptional regulator [Sphingobium chlorophenolicum]|uniref:Transcriptional regulator n=1 Tax=Sphingobium chlorophenolicum TaxID=46429 RepID=A0A081RGR5_SPHCR|nr:LysR family transcriptional regulator [Sphingobium chlorophenolicum]KEQ54388.1 Transcriptional regulator precursor [Sphingobium chlorophenolicum]
MDLRKLRHIATLGRERHYGLAADRLGLTQSALTRSIQSAEAELGLRLFDRGRDGVHPTRAGEALLADAMPLLRQMETLERNMALLSDRGSGEVRCGFGPLAAALVLEDMLSHAARDHGALRVRTKLGDVAELQALLREGELDFAVLAHILVEDRPDLSFRRIGQTRLGALVRRHHPLADRTVDEGAIAAFPIIGGTGGSPIYAPTISCDNFEIAGSVTLASDAIWITAEALADDRYALVHGLPIAQPLDLVVASLARRTLSAQALLLIDLIIAALRPRRA